MSALTPLALLLVASCGTAVVFTRDPLKQAIVAGVFGMSLCILLLVFSAPDVAMSELTVGTIAYPLMVLLALARTRSRPKS